MAELYGWIGFILFWVVAVAVVFLSLAGAVLFVAVKLGTGLFGYVLVRESDYHEKEQVWLRAKEAYRWFGSFQDLDVIWDLLFKGGRTDLAREKFARLRGTNVYNVPLEKTKDVA